MLQMLLENGLTLSSEKQVSLDNLSLPSASFSSEVSVG